MVRIDGELTESQCVLSTNSDEGLTMSSVINWQLRQQSLSKDIE